jgi:dihydrodipicolinate synthase/N-acetylneuraminate lyase
LCRWVLSAETVACSGEDKNTELDAILSVEPYYNRPNQNGILAILKLCSQYLKTGNNLYEPSRPG